MTTEDLMKLMGDFPEINPSNYGDDDVNALNAWGIAAHTALEALGREVEQWKVDFNEVLIERDQARAQLAAIRAQEPVGVVDEGDDGLFADFETPEGVKVKLGDKLYASPAAKDAGLVADGCVWTQDSHFEMGDTYDSACGEKWAFIDGGPEENNVRFCQGCGKPVKLAASPKIGGV